MLVRNRAVGKLDGKVLALDDAWLSTMLSWSDYENRQRLPWSPFLKIPVELPCAPHPDCQSCPFKVFSTNSSSAGCTGLMIRLVGPLAFSPFISGPYWHVHKARQVKWQLKVINRFFTRMEAKQKLEVTGDND